MNCLITAIGSFSADIIIKKLKEINKCLLVGIDIYDKELLVDAYNVDYFYQVPKVVYENEYRKSIEKIVIKHNITHILPLTDVEVDYYNKYRKYYDDLNIKVCISSEDTISICRNKKKQQEFIDKNVKSITTIPTKTIKELLNTSFEFPLIAKPIDGRSSIGLKYLYDQNDLNYMLSSDINKYVFQPFIKGNVVTVDVICDEKRCVAIPREELLRTLNGAGISVKVYSDKKLENNCKELAIKLGIIGCANFEFILDSNGLYHYVECNPRFSGGVEFSCIAGYNCVLNHINSFEGKEIETFELNKNIFIARKYEEYVTKEY